MQNSYLQHTVWHSQDVIYEQSPRLNLNLSSIPPLLRTRDLIPSDITHHVVSHNPPCLVIPSVPSPTKPSPSHQFTHRLFQTHQKFLQLLLHKKSTHKKSVNTSFISCARRYLPFKSHIDSIDRGFVTVTNCEC
jgi:hypothetical protein